MCVAWFRMPDREIKASSESRGFCFAQSGFLLSTYVRVILILLRRRRLQCLFMAPDESGAFALGRIASPIQLSCVQVSYDPGSNALLM